MDEPKNKPTDTVFSEKIKFAKVGYIIIAISPKIVILAIANAVSSLLALIKGAVATIAVAPQTLVPTAISVARLIFKLKNFLLNFIITNVDKIHGTITIKPLIPKSTMSDNPNLIPIKIIPSFKICFVQKLMPGSPRFTDFDKFSNMKPMTMDKIIGDTGLFSKPRISLPINELKKMLNKATVEHKQNPNKNLKYLIFEVCTKLRKVFHRSDIKDQNCLTSFY